MKVIVLAIFNLNGADVQLMHVQAFNLSLEGLLAIDKDIINYVSSNLSQIHWVGKHSKKIFLDHVKNINWQSKESVQDLLRDPSISNATSHICRNAKINIRLSLQEVVG